MLIFTILRKKNMNIHYAIYDFPLPLNLLVCIIFESSIKDVYEWNGESSTTTKKIFNIIYYIKLVISHVYECDTDSMYTNIYFNFLFKDKMF